MQRRPLLCGVLAFVSGIAIVAYGNWGLGLVVTCGVSVSAGLMIKQKSKKSLWMAILLLCFFFGLLNGFRLFYQGKLEQNMEKYAENDTLEVYVKGRIYECYERQGYREYRLHVEETYIANQQGTFNRPFYENYNLLLYDGKLKTSLNPGCKVYLYAQGGLPRSPVNPGEFNGKSYYYARGIRFIGQLKEVYKVEEPQNPLLYWLWSLRRYFCEIYAKLLPLEQAGIMEAMILGDKGHLSPEIKALYQSQGIAHILAISGLHISFIGKTIYIILKRLGAGRNVSCIVALSLLCLYGWMTGLSGSTIRALIMFVFMLLADYLERSYDLPTTMGVAGCMMLIQYPHHIMDGGFQLSFGAVVALAFVWPVLQEFIVKDYENWRFPKKVKFFLRKGLEAFGASLSVQLVTIPLILNLFYQFPLYGILLNLVVLPLMSVLMISGFSGLLFYPLLPGVAKLLILPASCILELFEQLCRLSNLLPGSVMTLGASPLWKMVLYYLLLAMLCYGIKHKGKWFYIGIFAICCCLLTIKASRLQVTVFDVGQGDGIFIETPGHHSIWMDGGSSSKKGLGEKVLIPGSLYYGYDTIDYVFLSHMDSDHTSGIKELLETEEVYIETLVLSEYGKGSEEYSEWEALCRQHGTEIKYMKTGEGLFIDGVTITCLHPDGGEQGSVLDANNQSLVLRLEYKKFSMLFTGDIEAKVEEELEVEKVDVLKVAHHGSKSSSTKYFLEQATPRVSIISVGENNSYGHPAKEVLQRIEEIGSSIYCTKDNGAIVITVSGKEEGDFHINTYIK